MYVYLLRSLSHEAQRYVGLTGDLKKRLADHNAGKSPHTSKHTPWEAVWHCNGTASGRERVRWQEAAWRCHW